MADLHELITPERGHLSLTSPAPHPSRWRAFIAVLLLTAMGLMAAASLVASRPNVPGPVVPAARPHAVQNAGNASGPDPC